MGAAAVVLTDVETSLAMQRAVVFRSTAHAQHFPSDVQARVPKLEGCTSRGTGVAAAHLKLDDLWFVETHDCFTIAELLEYEAMGLAPAGRGAQVIKEGITAIDGKLPINASGGLKAKGHPIGATGVSMHAMTAMQLCGELPGEITVKNAKLGGVFNMGGVAVANYVSILERVR